MSASAVYLDGSLSKRYFLEEVFRTEDNNRSGLFIVSRCDDLRHLSVVYDPRQQTPTVIAQNLGDVVWQPSSTALPASTFATWQTLTFSSGRVVIRLKETEGSLAYFDGSKLQAVSRLDVDDFCLLYGRHTRPIGVCESSSLPLSPLLCLRYAHAVVKLALNEPGQDLQGAYQDLSQAAHDVLLAQTSGQITEEQADEATADSQRPAG